MEAIQAGNSAPIKQLLKYAALCSDGVVEFEGGEEKHIGDPTETSIVLAAHKNGMPKEQLNWSYPRLAVLPSIPSAKLMTTVNAIDGQNVVNARRVFDVLAGKCTSGDVEAGRKYIEELSRQAWRVLAVAYKNIDTVPDDPTPEELESDLHFMGPVGMIDPPRPEARDGGGVPQRRHQTGNDHRRSCGDRFRHRQGPGYFGRRG